MKIPNKTSNILFCILAFITAILRLEFPELLKLPSLWTHSYFVSTAGNVSAETIKKYIEEQKTRE